MIWNVMDWDKIIWEDDGILGEGDWLA